MSNPDPLVVMSLLRPIIENEITIGILRAERIKLEIALHPNPTEHLNKRIADLEKHTSDLATRFVHTVES